MTKPPTAVPSLPFRMDHGSAMPFYRQLYEEMRTAILSGRLRAGTRLPSTRALASELGVSRTTVVNAFEQLIDEGYLEGKVGAGTYVAQVLPEEHMQAFDGRGSRDLIG